MGIFASLCGAFGAWFRRSGRELPERIDTGDLVLVSIATHKTSRLVAKDRITSTIRAPFTEYQDDSGPNEVEEKARRSGFGRAVGELILCPYCLGLWVAAAFMAGLLVAPRLTRVVAALFTALSGSDVLQIAYKKAEDSL
jgi:uncharacterized protein DUF1360